MSAKHKVPQSASQSDDIMFGEINDTPRKTIGFVLVPDFAMMSAAAAIEPVRAANLVGGSELYRAIFLSPEGEYIRSSCGGGFETTAFGAAPEHLDMIFVIASTKLSNRRYTCAQDIQRSCPPV